MSFVMPLEPHRDRLCPYRRPPVSGVKIFSQSDEDGVIQRLIKNIRVSSEHFIEFGVQNYYRSEYTTPAHA